MDNFKEYPGKIESNWYKLPVLHNHENGRIWKIFIRLVKITAMDVEYKHDWDILMVDEVPMKPDYLEDQHIDKNIIAQVWVETGLAKGKISRHAPTLIDKPNNIGKKNERNVLKRAMVFAKSKWNSKIDEGFKDENEAGYESKCNSKNTKNTKTRKAPEVCESNVMYFPMLLRNYSDYKSNIKFPCYVQAKLDGVRAVAFKTSDGVVQIYSRKLIEYSMDKTAEELSNIPNNIYIDGEFYKHGLSLQKISGLVRNGKDTNELNFCVFDCFIPQKPHLTLKERLEILQSTIKQNLKEKLKSGEVKPHKNIVKILETRIVHNEKELQSIYRSCINKNYEGIVIKNMDNKYIFSKTYSY